MTVQIKHFIELPDVLCLRFTCKHEGCGAALSMLLSDGKFQTANRSQMFLDTCPSCGRAWADVGGSTFEPLITKFTASLNQLIAQLHGEHPAPLGFSIMLEIKPEATLGDHR